MWRFDSEDFSAGDQAAKAVVQSFELLGDAVVVAGKAIEVMENGVFCKRRVCTFFRGGYFELIELEDTEVLRGDHVREEVLKDGLRIVEFTDSGAKLLEDGPLIGVES